MSTAVGTATIGIKVVPRICCRCGLLKTEFTIRYKDGKPYNFQNHCTDCQRMSQSRSTKKPSYRIKLKKRRDQKRINNSKKILEYFKKHHCVDCGESNPFKLLFDHVRGQKLFSIGKKIRDMSWSRIEDEINKCDVRCVNCHLRRHASNGRISHNSGINKKRIEIYNILSQRGCVDCGIKDPIVLQFDHIKNKKAMISDLVNHRHSRMAVINDEISKCDVRCGNCHQVISTKRGNYKGEWN